MATICGLIQAHRKQAFFLRMVAISAHHLGAKNLVKKPYSVESNASLSCMRMVCTLLENGRDRPMEDDLHWIERYAEPEVFSLGYGWPSLRIEVYKEAIAISEAAEGANS